MRLRVSLLALSLLLLLAASASAVTVERYTVIPVVMRNGLNSGVSDVGDRFRTVCATTQCGGFPPQTEFIGVVTEVVRATRDEPGQIGVEFTQAILPDGTTVEIDGVLTSPQDPKVNVDPETGVLKGEREIQDNRNRFIAYGAGAGLVIGLLTDGNILEGTLLGAAAGWLAGALSRQPAVGRNVDVPPGTEIAIMLTEPVTFNVGAGVGAGPTPGVSPPPPTAPIDSIRLPANMQPYYTDDQVLMVPFRPVMDQFDIPFRYNNATKTVTINTATGQIIHSVGTNVAYINGNLVRLPAQSRIINSRLYVPADFVRAATGRTLSWQQDTGRLAVS